MDEMVERVRKAVELVLDTKLDNIGNDDLLLDGQIKNDSLMCINLIVALEDEFSVALDDIFKDDTFDTVNNICEYIICSKGGVK